MSGSPRNNKWNWKRRTLKVVSILLCVILVALVGFAAYGSYILGKINYRTEHPTLSQGEAESIKKEELEPITPDDDGLADGGIISEETVKPIEKGEHIVNILLIGQDRRPGEGTQRSDSMILVTFNKSTKDITLTSVMRDQYVNIPGYGNDKLCHAYQYGGMPLLNKTLLNHFGIQVDGNVEVDFSGFQKIIDRLGGVEIQLTEKEAVHLNKVWGWELKKGKNLLSGNQALAYARLRAIDSDYNRAQRQRKVLLTLFEKYRNLSLPKMLSLTEELLPLVTTDISRDRVVSFVLDLFPIFSGAEIENFRLPVDGTFKGGYVKVNDTHKMWCQYHIDFTANRDALDKVING